MEWNESGNDQGSHRNPHGIAVWLATGFGLGRIPKAPGTFGSLLGVPLAWAIGLIANPRLQAATTVVVCLASVAVCSVALRKIARGKDPGCVVIDEVVSLPITFFLIPITDWLTALLGFALFRLFDIAKPPPARQLEKLPGAWGVMADDWAAAIYANLALRLILFWMPTISP